MKRSTVHRMMERGDYICKKMGPHYSVKWYNQLVHAIEECCIDFYDNIGYCGAGDDSCENESISSKAVPDFDCINWSCWFHDRLRECINFHLIDQEMTDRIMKYSAYYDAVKGKKGFAKFKALLIARIYYRGVQIETLFNK